MSHFTRERKCKKKCGKKSKVTNPTSTCAFNKKDNKDYVDVTENAMIDILNDDCLAEIFMYLSACERSKIALVCKKWKKVLKYSWQNIKKLELIHWEYNDQCPAYSYKYPTINEQLRFLRLLLAKCGRYITDLDVTSYGNYNIIPVINESCPSLVKLRLRFEDVQPILLVNAFSRLSKLKELKIIFQHINDSYDISVALIDLLKSVAGTLTELTLSNWNRQDYYKRWRIPETFIHVIPKLKALKSIKTDGILIDTDLSLHLKQFGILDSQWLDNNIKKKILYKNIKKLKLTDYQATDDCLYTIANCMKKLRDLTIICERVTDAGIVAISKMDKLSYLELRGPGHVTDSSVGLLKNLYCLHLPYCNKITDVSVTKILENSPTMRLFYMIGSAVTFKFLERAREVTANRKTYLELGLSYSPGIQKYESRYLQQALFNSSIKMMYWSTNKLLDC
ncbi:uncharacterized protein LOC122850067 [Aphidius gifuensis]|uniref:uncharacterized protein LOC122850067 n=1 Tax=Aphidius gifuensis TaxID=684658 RepID=UPI001CDBA550|nr:uncharacterized protein LOC122850067 [Aphidius gifuensis]